MGYRIKPLTFKKRSWKLQFESYVGKRGIRDIPVSEYAVLGFREAMSLDEAKARKDALNRDAHVKRHETRRNASRERQILDQTTQAKQLPESDVEAFRALYAKSSKFDSHWRVAASVICDLDIEIEYWGENARLFYREFIKRKMSPSYVHKVRSVINLWGRFQARKYRRSFEPVPAPRGHDREKIADTFFDKSPRGHASDPLTPEALESARSALLPEHYRWLFVSVWFGLRPSEVDAISKGQHFEIQRHGKVSVLSIFQSKLSSVPRPERWKLIPVITEQQFVALDYIRQGKQQILQRPVHKTMKNHFGERIGLYGGRKGFTDLFLDLGHSLEDISAWLGHTTIERTWKVYKSRSRLRLSKAS